MSPIRVRTRPSYILDCHLGHHVTHLRTWEFLVRRSLVESIGHKDIDDQAQEGHENHRVESHAFQGVQEDKWDLLTR